MLRWPDTVPSSCSIRELTWPQSDSGQGQARADDTNTRSCDGGNGGQRRAAFPLGVQSGEKSVSKKQRDRTRRRPPGASAGGDTWARRWLRAAWGESRQPGPASLSPSRIACSVPTPALLPLVYSCPRELAGSPAKDGQCLTKASSAPSCQHFSIKTVGLPLPRHLFSIAVCQAQRWALWVENPRWPPRGLAAIPLGSSTHLPHHPQPAPWEAPSSVLSSPH